MKKKIILISSLIILIGIATIFIFSYFVGNKKSIYYWRTSQVEKGNISLIVTATGLVGADTTVAVGTQVSGILSKLFVDYNSVVKKGQVIAQIDTTILYATKIDAQALLEKSQAQLNGYKREYERQKILVDGKVISQMDFDLSLTNFETAQSVVKSMKAQLDRAIINLRYATIKSPINGVVISRNIDEGQTVIANFNTPTLFTIVNNLKKMQVQANVSEADIGEIKVGQTVNFTVDAYPYEIFNGHVQQIRLQPVTVQNVVNYIVIIDAVNPDLKLMPGLTANINIKIQHRDNVYKVSANALSFTPPLEYIENNVLFNDSIKKIWHDRIGLNSKKVITEQNNDSYLWIKQGDDIYPLKVIKGLSDGIFTQVEGNLYNGEEVVTGINSSPSSVKTVTKKNPFLPKFPTRNRRM